LRIANSLWQIVIINV